QRNSPDSAGFQPDHGCVRLAMERFAELRHIRGDPIHPPLAWRMRINSLQHARELIGAVLAPHVGPAEEEALLGGQAINWRWFFSSESAHKRHISNAQAAIVGDVLPQG